MTDSPNTSLEGLRQELCRFKLTPRKHKYLYTEEIDQLLTLFNNSLKEKMIEARIDELDKITKDTFEKPETPENQNDQTWQGGYRFAKNSLKRYKLNRIQTLKTTNTNRGVKEG